MQERGGDVVGKVGDDLAGAPASVAGSSLERVGGDDFEAPGMAAASSPSAGETAPVALDRDDPASAAAKQRPRQTAWTGADLDNRRMRRADLRPARSDPSS